MISVCASLRWATCVHMCRHHHTSGSKRSRTSKSFPPSLCCCFVCRGCVCVFVVRTLKSTLPSQRFLKSLRPYCSPWTPGCRQSSGIHWNHAPVERPRPLPQPLATTCVVSASASLTSFGSCRRVRALQAGVCASVPGGQVALCSDGVGAVMSANLLSCPSVPHV